METRKWDYKTDWPAKLRSYLWGMETICRLEGCRFGDLYSDPTYEVWKRNKRIFHLLILPALRSYLWGMETKSHLSIVGLHPNSDPTYEVWKRAKFNEVCCNPGLHSDPTYEVWKLVKLHKVEVVGDTPILPMRYGNDDYLKNDLISIKGTPILPMRYGNFVQYCWIVK